MASVYIGKTRSRKLPLSYRLGVTQHLERDPHEEVMSGFLRAYLAGAGFQTSQPFSFLQDDWMGRTQEELSQSRAWVSTPIKGGRLFLYELVEGNNTGSFLTMHVVSLSWLRKNTRGGLPLFPQS